MSPPPWLKTDWCSGVSSGSEQRSLAPETSQVYPWVFPPPEGRWDREADRPGLAAAHSPWVWPACWVQCLQLCRVGPFRLLCLPPPPTLRPQCLELYHLSIIWKQGIAYTTCSLLKQPGLSDIIYTQKPACHILCGQGRIKIHP